MSNKLLRTVEVNVRVRCVLWQQCSWEGKRKVKRMKAAMKQGCPKCGSPVEFISAAAAGGR